VLGSALTGMATPTATLSATAALNNTFLITRRRAIGRGACCASALGLGRRWRVCLMHSIVALRRGVVAHASAQTRYLLPATRGGIRCALG
jgi:hypothetical protein